MARLSDFLAYIDERRATVGRIEVRLRALLEKYERFFQEIASTRERELQQLTEQILVAPGSLDPALHAKLDRAQATAAASFAREQAALEKQAADFAALAEKRRMASLAVEKSVRAKNTKLDAEEEALKARAEELRARIKGYNDRILQLSSGFGFFANFFRMRHLTKERRAIDQEQADVLARIELIRQKWAALEGDHASKEQVLRDEWLEIRKQEAALLAKLEYLKASRERIVTRSAMEAVLFELVDRPVLGAAGDPACPRCTRPNPAANRFCGYCAQRLGPDRTDLAGSLEELAELNHHFAVFAEGMKACQEILALVGGLAGGLKAFRKSVSDMIDTENRYPLAKLAIDVPGASVGYGRAFDELEALLAANDERLHPTQFAARAKDLISKVFTEPKIKGYFETMGQELSRTAGAQW